MPVEPTPTTFEFPPTDTADERGRVTVGGDLGAGTLLAAYRAGLFPMRQLSGQMTWWAPDPRAILTVDGLHVSRRLRREVARFEIRVDTAFDAVVEACAVRALEAYHWITPEIRDAYGALHRLGWAHSVETWEHPAAGGGAAELVGGLYGVAIGGLFGGESMFHRRTDASKVAVLGLVDLLRDDDNEGRDRIIDVQWMTPLFAALGAIDVSREEYHRRLERALELPLPRAFSAAARAAATS